MTMKSYSTAARRQAGIAVKFDIDGEWFTTVPSPPAGAIGELARGKVSDDGARQFVAMLDWFDMVLDEDSRTRFAVNLKTKPGWDEEFIAEVFSDLLEELSGHPSTGPSDSPGGPSTTGASSTDAASSPGSTP